MAYAVSSEVEVALSVSPLLRRTERKDPENELNGWAESATKIKVTVDTTSVSALSCHFDREGACLD